MPRKSRNWTQADLLAVQAGRKPAAPLTSRQKGQRTRRKNTGKWLEKDLADCHEIYAQHGLATLHKVDPPSRMVKQKGIWVPVYLANPFLDFAGAWQERAGRALFVEAKSTLEDKLGLDADGGLKTHQRESLQAWRAAGAAVCVLWGFQGEVRYLSLALIEARLRNGSKHVHWAHTDPVPAGLGFLRFDWLQNLRADASL